MDIRGSQIAEEWILAHKSSMDWGLSQSHKWLFTGQAGVLSCAGAEDKAGAPGLPGLRVGGGHILAVPGRPY
jgi:hypothetical protein